MNIKHKILADKVIYSTIFSFVCGVVLTVIWQILELHFYDEVQVRTVDDIILVLFMMMSFFASWCYLSNNGLNRLLGLFPLLSVSYWEDMKYLGDSAHVEYSVDEVEILKEHNQFLILRVADLEQECDRLESLLRENYNEKAEDTEQV